MDKQTILPKSKWRWWRLFEVDGRCRDPGCPPLSGIWSSNSIDGDGSGGPLAEVDWQERSAGGVQSGAHRQRSGGAVAACLRMPDVPPLCAAARYAVILACRTVVWWGLHQGELIWLCLALGLLFALRLLPQSVRWREMAALSRLLAGGGPAAPVLSPCSAAARLLLYYPVLVSGSLLALFGWSLWQPEDPGGADCPSAGAATAPAAIRYTRQVTRIWCGFFIFNGAIAIATIAAWGLGALESLRRLAQLICW